MQQVRLGEGALEPLADVNMRVARGANGLAKSVLRLEVPSRTDLAGRALLCFGIPGQVPPCERLGMGLVCMECGCLAMAKIRVASQECPLGKWGAVDAVARAAETRPVKSRAPVGPPDM